MVRRGDGALARLVEEGPVAGLTDGQLLDRFATRGGAAAEAAFAALVARHGPMVARVCRGMLRAEHDVEDAFQATFLVLVRRAHSLGERDLLAPWLYGVAHRVARKARAVAARRRGREGDSAGFDPPARADSAAAARVELGPVLHEEVDRLPARYRQPVVLCHLQGLTHAEAAQELAWPVGTVSVRLARARKILADRLSRRGVTASVALVTTTLAAEATAAAAPLAPAWIKAAALAALATATGLSLTAAAVSTAAVTLARRTCMTMLLSSWKWLAVPVTVALATTTGAALVGSTGPENQAKDKATPKPVVVKSAPPSASPDVRFFITQPAGAPKPGADPSEIVEAESITLTAKYANMKGMIGHIEGTDPDAIYKLTMSGGKLLFRPDKLPNLPAAVQPAAPVAEPVMPTVAVPPVVSIGNGHFMLGDLPPGYFDLPAADPATPGGPRPVQIGQIVQIEVLQALPGRPISGERVVRADGTISLGFYGDLPVVGLNRDQIKVKLVEKLRHFVNDEALGLFGGRTDENNNVELMAAVPPLESNRLFVDDQPVAPPRTAPKEETSRSQTMTGAAAAVGKAAGVQVGDLMVVEVLEALPGRPITGEKVVRPDGTISLGFYGDVAAAGLTRDQIKVKVIERLRKTLGDERLGLRVTNPRTNAVEARSPLQSDRVFVDETVGSASYKHPTEPAADGKVRVGQILDVEVLKGLPNRPITGHRLVTPDGTISLGFYGSVPVVGLTRDQIKVKVIDHLRSKLSDADLGLVGEVNGEIRPIAPAESSHVFVDDVITPRSPRTSEQVEKLAEQVDDLSRRLDEALGAIRSLRSQPAP